ncbi:hypothetical protein ACPCTG_31665 [Streptomyces pseudogriseolus]|uniref:hypothetical protein n=1 Tax=Streptomyces pseudogriseolus TaxID=36817 RepID=UPI003FA1AB34
MATILVITLGSLLTLINLLLLAGRISHKTACGWITVLMTGSGIGSAIAGWTTNVYISAAGAALMGWEWWNSGGGDGTRRRLKSWASRFQGVRRTAPQGA